MTVTVIFIIWTVLVNCRLTVSQLDRFPVDLMSVPAHFYKFGPDVGDNIAPVNDDGSTGVLPIAVAFPFYSHVHGELYVSTNGVVSFLRDVPEFTPEGFPLAGDRRMIAPFWADIDTRGHGGRVYYQEYYGNDGETLNVRRKARDEAVDAFPGLVYTPTWVMVVTWYRVACFGTCSDENGSILENNIQLAISTDGVKSFVSFHYGTMTWTTGDASDRPALVGFNVGDGIGFEMLNESLTEDILNVQSSSNIGVPGVRVYRIDNANIQAAGCSNDFVGTLQVYPRYASVLGGKRVTITGPCFNDTNMIKCKFADVVVDGRVVDGQVDCAAPFMGVAATMTLSVSVDEGQNYIYHGKFIYVKYDPTKEVERVPGPGWSGGTGPSPLIRWDTNNLNVTHVNISFVMFSLDENRATVLTEVLIKSNVPNTPVAGSTSAVFTITLLEEDNLLSPSYGAIRISSSISSDTDFLWSDIHEPEWYLKHFWEDVASANILAGKRRKRAVTEDIQRAWNEIDEFFNDVGNDINDIKLQIDRKANQIGEAFFSARCDDWVRRDQSDPADFSDVPPPPCTLEQAINDPNFVVDSACNMGKGCGLHEPDAFHCVRSRRPGPSGSSQQACYSESGELLTFDRGGGTVDRSGINNWFTVPVLGVSIPTPGSGINHFLDDVQSYFICCKWSNNCDKYSQQRPTDDCSEYNPPGSGSGLGDPHVFTLDGFEYTFNGRGEYVLLQALSDGLMVHARTSQAVNGTGFKVQATEWSALAMQMTGTSIIQVQVSDLQGLEVLIDGISQEFDDVVNEITFNGGRVTRSQQVDNSTQCLVILPSATFQITSESTTRLSFVIQLLNHLRGNTRGLLGVWNDDTTDDLQALNGTTLDPEASQETIFYSFGETWRIAEENSLFNYDLGPSYSYYNNVSFIPVFPSPEDLNSPDAIAVCGTSQQCLFDFFATDGDVTFALQTMKTVDVIKTIIENTKPVVTCGFPVHPPNSNISGNGSLFGAVVEFTCHDGYKLSGSSRIICQADGKWTAVSPSCVLEDGTEDDTEDGSKGLLTIIITGSVAGLLFLVVVIGVVYVCCSREQATPEDYSDNAPQNYTHPSHGPVINTKRPPGSTAYTGPYSQYHM